MAGIDDVFVFNLTDEDSAVGSEPDATMATDFQAEQTFASDETGDAGPTNSQRDARLAGDVGARLQVQCVALQFDALDVAGERLSQHEFARTASCELVDKQ